MRFLRSDRALEFACFWWGGGAGSWALRGRFELGSPVGDVQCGVLLCLSGVASNTLVERGRLS
eukprot:3013924-Heterocapsa_arctica.AAC.1